MTYIIIRYGSNSANQPMCHRAVLGTVEVEGKSPRTRQRQLQARLGASLVGTIHATTTFRRDDGSVWDAFNNQHFTWIPWSHAKADDKDAALEADAWQEVSRCA